MFAAEKNRFGKCSGPERQYLGSYNFDEVNMKISGRKPVSAILICLCGALLANAAIIAAQTATRQSNNPTSAKGAQAAETASTTVDAILDRYISALGGVPAWKKSSTRVIKGTVVLSPPPLKGIVELYQTAPDKMFFQMKVPKIGVAWVLVNGNEGWQKDFASEPRRLQGEELADAKIDADFFKEVDLRRLYSRLEYGGTSLIEGQSVDVVRAFTTAGRSHTLYFDRNSGLLVREDFVSVGAHGPETVQTFFEDYRELKDAGIRYPFSVRQVAGRAVQAMHFEEVSHNVPIDNSLFAAPPAH